MIHSSPNLAGWLQAHETGLAFTGHRTGGLWMVGASRGRLALHEEIFPGAFGLALDGGSLWLAAGAMVWRLQDMGQARRPAGRVFETQARHATGALDLQQVGVARDGGPILVSAAYSCLAKLSEGRGLRPLWTPPFISALAAEDRCRLNGLAMSEGAPAYVTAYAPSDVADGWRAHRRDGGVLIDVPTGRIVAEGLSMPRSPRIAPDGRVWLLEAGRGQVVAIDPRSGAREDIAFCPGFLRGLALHRGFAIVTSSRPSEGEIADLDLAAALRTRDADPACAVLIIDMRTGDTTAWLRFDGPVSQLFDVVAVPGAGCPTSIGPASPPRGSQIAVQRA